ncbi:MAG: hypothetical protein JL50_12900 [Peptococcaceae bacterium BICA1-7]|nr:MAG: hypothetical protein JL50_12900 [Peptococcaceae bacterium BICA1-7]
MTMNNYSVFNNMIDVLQYQSEVKADKIVYTFLDYTLDDDYVENKITYRQLEKKASIVSFFLQQHQCFGERAILLYPPGIDYIVAFFACLRAGVLAVPSYPPYSTKIFSQFISIVKDALPKFVITNKLMAEVLKSQLGESPDFPDIIWIETDGLDDEELHEYKPTPNKIAFLQYTSGSTSQPRGVMVTHDNLLHNLFLIRDSFQHESHSCGVIWLPPYHDMGLIGGILQPLYAGFPVVLMSPLDFLKKPIRWLRAITSYRANTSGGPNFAYELCIRKVTPEQRQSLDLRSWDLAFNGAELVQADTIEEFAKTFEDCGFNPRAFYPCYGLAESTLIVTGGLKGELPKIAQFDKESILDNIALPKNSHDGGLHKRYVGCGYPLHVGEVAIVDQETCVKLEQGCVGEIWVKNPSVAFGYWNNNDETERIFNAYLSDTNEGPFLRTGDLGFIYDGELFVIGRINDIIIRGKNYYPYDIEKSAEISHPCLRKGCNALFSVGEADDMRIILMQEIKNGYEDIDLREVVSSIRDLIALNHQLYVNEIVLIRQNSIPKTSSGKIRRSACRENYLRNKFEAVFGEQQNLDSL